MEGDMLWLGAHEQCFSIKRENDVPFNAKYCLTQLFTPLPVRIPTVSKTITHYEGEDNQRSDVWRGAGNNMLLVSVITHMNTLFIK